jgi:hypothetical protein
MRPTETKNAAKRLTSAHFQTKRHEQHPAGSRSHKRRKNGIRAGLMREIIWGKTRKS